MEKLEKNIYNEATKLHYKLNEKEVYIPEMLADFYKRNGVGKYGRMHCRYLIIKHESYYNHLLLSGELNDHLIEIDIRANRLVNEVISHLAKEENCDDALKKNDPLQWYGLMSNYKKCAEEIVLNEIVYRK